MWDKYPAKGSKDLAGIRPLNDVFLLSLHEDELRPLLAANARPNRSMCQDVAVIFVHSQLR